MRFAILTIVFLLLTFAYNAKAQTKVLIVTEDLPPLQIVKNGQLHDGLAYNQVKRIVESANLTAKWMVAPWSRAYQMAVTEPNVLLFSVVRTPHREDKFIWIGQLYLMEIALVSLKSKQINVSTLEQAKSLLVGAKRNDVVFDFLEQDGFRADNNIVVVRDTTDTFKMLFKGRVDLVPASKMVIEAYCKNSNCSLQDFTFNIPLPNMVQDFYLVASKGTDPKVIQALRHAYQLTLVEDNKKALQP